jgi:hypothetical protein
VQALLDMLASFADLVAMSPHPHCRPDIMGNGPLVIKAGMCIVLIPRIPFLFLYYVGYLVCKRAASCALLSRVEDQKFVVRGMCPYSCDICR